MHLLKEIEKATELTNLKIEEKNQEIEILKNKIDELSD